MLFLKACVTVSWQEKGNLKAPTAPGCGAGGAGGARGAGNGPTALGSAAVVTHCPPRLRAAMGVGEAVRLRVGEEGLEEGMQWGYNLGWKGDALRMQLGMQLGWNRNGMGLHLGAQLGWGGWNRDALGIELGVHQENTGDATGMQWGWNRDDWNATKISYR